VDVLIFSNTGKRLSDLQRTVLKKVWQGHKYLEIAAHYGCTEGHVKDVSAELWQSLSKQLGEKITKSNCRTALSRYFQTAPPIKQTAITHHFVGRARAIADLDALIDQGAKVIVIQGEGGLGKTTLAQQYLQTQGFDLVLELLMAKETQTITSAERVVEEWLKQDFNQEPGIEFGVTLGRLKRQLHDRRVGVLIDNLEPALDQQGCFTTSHRSYVELLRVLADARVQSVTLVTSRDRLCESSLNVAHYRLLGLDQRAWNEFFTHRRITIDLPTLEKMHCAYGGNAKAMGILCGAIWEDSEGDMAAYWRETHGNLWVTTDLKDLVANQVNRLQSLDPQAYRLFYRLGCYRYQDVPTLTTQGLQCLLWDVHPDDRRATIASLRNRSLIECHRNEYWLHPVIRAEAIARLRTSDEWQIVNAKAAEFWTARVETIETTKYALTALEAYYHYVEIDDFESASTIILKSRNNQWLQFLPLGSTLYRMGLVQPVLAAISHIICNIKSDQNLSELYNILGDLQWITGNIHEAIACQKKTISLANQAIKSLTFTSETKRQFYYLKMLAVDSQLSMGLYKIDLWELEAAAGLFQQVIRSAQHTEHHRWAEKASVCLALVHSYLGLTDALSLANNIYHTLSAPLVEQSGRFAYFMQILGQTYLNLGNFDRAIDLYRQALSFAETGHYTQIKAKTLIGFAEIDRQQQSFAMALNRHSEAIELLDQIGAKCDLANAYFQLGLTYQAMREDSKSRESFDQAISLFLEMHAPKQVEKVLKQATL
ncbi:MAG: tetratricopeptide repeat protein, partial [Phormidesmis sp. CAN_BIN36]|nr:tetratricopeptide repeat protein [Phormidesmis sp. CAN_BIN36]